MAKLSTLTVSEATAEIHRSVRFIGKAIRGEFRNVPRLPAIRLGKRRLIQRHMLKFWADDYNHSHSNNPVATPSL